MNWNFTHGLLTRKIFLKRGLLSLMIMVVTSAYATETDDSAPSEELISFMLDWQTDDQQWVDPLELEQIESNELDNQAAEDSNNE